MSSPSVPDGLITSVGATVSVGTPRLVVVDSVVVGLSVVLWPTSHVEVVLGKLVGCTLSVGVGSTVPVVDAALVAVLGSVWNISFYNCYLGLSQNRKV